MSWAELFCAAAGIPVPADRDRLARQIDELVTTSARAWPTFTVGPEAFVRYVATRLPKNSPPDQPLLAFHGDDLYLACACVHGEKAALLALEQRWLRPLEPSLRAAAPPGQSEDVLQLVREKLFVAQGDQGRPKLADYAGRGPLSRWLRVAAMRTAFNLHRSQRAAAEEDLATIAAAGHDLEFDYIQACFREDFKRAFGGAVATLTKRQRSLLRFHYAEGLTLEQVARVYRAGRATVARWLAEARRQLLAETGRQIAERLQVRQSQVDSMMKLLDSRVDLTLSAVFRHSCDDDGSETPRSRAGGG